MPIPMTGPVLQANSSSNRGRRWLFLGLLGVVAGAWMTREDDRDRGAALAPGVVAGFPEPTAGASTTPAPMGRTSQSGQASGANFPAAVPPIGGHEGRR